MTLTIQEVRDEVRDRYPADHTVHIDIIYTDDDILSAMRSCARRYNSIEPRTSCVSGEALPGDDSMFMDGTVAALFRRSRNSAALNELPFSAGDVQFNADTVLKNNLEKLASEYSERFESAAKQRKLSENIAASFRRIF